MTEQLTLPLDFHAPEENTEEQMEARAEEVLLNKYDQRLITQSLTRVKGHCLDCRHSVKL